MPIYQKLKEYLRHRLAGKYLPLVVAFLAVLLTSGSITTGLQSDDYIHRYKLKQRGSIAGLPSAMMDLYTFTSGIPEENQKLIEVGEAPWWTLPQLRVSFFRPLAAFSLWLDYQLWPEKPSWMHVHSLIWFWLMIWTAAILYRRFMTTTWIAGLAALLFAIDDTHGVPAGWLANRYVLIAAVFGFISLYCHDRWRRDHWRPGRYLGTIFFLLSLLCGEAGLAMGAYLLAYEVFLGPHKLSGKATGIAPYTLVAGTWLILYLRLGYGTFGSGFYSEPGEDPMAFLLALIVRVPVLLNGQWLLPDGAFYQYVPKPYSYLVLGMIYLLLGGLFLLLRPLLKRDAVARFWALGMILSLLPICTTEPLNRNLLFVGLGAMGLLAQFLAAWLDQSPWLPRLRVWRGLAKAFVVILIMVHFVHAPMMLPLTCKSMKRFEDTIIGDPLMELVQHEDLSGKTAVFINPPITFGISFVPLLCEEHHMGAPVSSFGLLSGLGTDLIMKRIDEVSFEIESQGFIAKDLDQLFRGVDYPMRAGQIVNLNGMRVEVLTLTADQRPLRVRFTCDRRLEDDGLEFYVWQDNGFVFVHYKMPQIGQTAHLLGPTTPLFGEPQHSARL
ncbi:MAG: hypothetical protein M0036_16950 [Desulfobacteraceae bacterium]|nr:hypothetical protein [Desulfobacteraceae bacterium]